MDKQQEQMKQNSNQEVEYTSGFLNEEEEEKPRKPKRPRKTIEQEIAELDAKRDRLMEKKRRQEAHEKIVFGATVLAMLKEMKDRNDRNGPVICKTILAFTEVEQPKNLEIIKNILYKLNIL